MPVILEFQEGLERRPQIQTYFQSSDWIILRNSAMTMTQSEIMSQDIENLKDTLDSIDTVEFQKSVNAILSARKIYIMGIRASAPLSEFMHFYMTVLFDDVILVRSTCTNELFEQIMPIGENDVMIGISYPGDIQPETINSMRYAKQKGATIISITDADGTPMTEFCDCKLLAKSSMASFVDSLTAPLSLINALFVTLGMHRKEHITKSFESLETLWSQYRVYEIGRDRKGRRRRDFIRGNI